jgi:transcriptional regulator with PAS, ATPase and Fis domain
MENELFGHERGAFTGASTSKTGLIQEAEAGTLFLDEIHSLSPMAQVKLLRLLQEKEYRPLGSGKTKKADIRLLAAMNVDFEEALSSGRLRQDLYYRINVIPVVMPPLRDRREDIPLLAHHFLHKYALEFKKSMRNFSPAAMRLLLRHEWPGNVRELENIVERAVIFAEEDLIAEKDIHFPSLETVECESFRATKSKMIASFEKSYIERLLIAHKGNVTKAAHEAKKHRRAFWALVRKYHIDLHHFRSSLP